MSSLTQLVLGSPKNHLGPGGSKSFMVNWLAVSLVFGQGALYKKSGVNFPGEGAERSRPPKGQVPIRPAAEIQARGRPAGVAARLPRSGDLPHIPPIPLPSSLTPFTVPWGKQRLNVSYTRFRMQQDIGSGLLRWARPSTSNPPTGWVGGVLEGGAGAVARAALRTQRAHPRLSGGAGAAQGGIPIAPRRYTAALIIDYTMMGRWGF